MIKTRKSYKKIIAALLTFSILLTSGPSTIIARADTSGSSITKLTSTEDEQGTMLHAWNWSFDTITSNLQAIKDAGYTTIQVSPVQPSKDDTLKASSYWWILYQPIGFSVGNAQLGDEQDFKDMCDAAHDKGLKIIVDVVTNHTGNDGGDGNVTIPDKVTFKNNTDYWHNPLHGVKSWDDRYEVTHGGLGLPDLNTGNPDVQTMIKNYLQNLLADGADGLRFDTAKHLELPSPLDDDKTSSNYWPAVLGGLKTYDNKTPFVYGEVLQGGADNYANYTELIDVTASNYGNAVRNIVGVGSSDSADLSDVNFNDYNSYNVPTGVDPSELVTWVESHDTYANDSAESTAMTAEQIRNAWALTASRANSTPLFFNRPAGRSKLQGNMGDAGDSNWKNPDVVAVNKFHNAMVGEGEKVTKLSSKVVMIERGSKGVVIVNLGDAITGFSADTKLEAATYNNCATAGGSLASDGTKLTGNLPKGITVLYKGGSQESPVTLPEVSIDKENSSFFDTLTLTLNAKNTTNAVYSINGGTETAYVNGQTITIGGDSVLPGSKIKVTVKASENNGQALEDYYYIKKDTSSVATIYFKKPAGWQIPYVYIYNDLKENKGAFPGERMTKIDDNLYKYELKGFTNAKVQFNDWFYGGHQLDALDISATGKMIYDADATTKWSASGDYEDKNVEQDKVENSTAKVYFQKPDAWTSDAVNIYFYKTGVRDIGWPGVPMEKVEGKTGLYAYTLPKGLEGAMVLFNTTIDGSGVQIPKDTGFKAPADTTMIYDNGWKEYIGNSAKVYFEQPSGWGIPSIKAYTEDVDGKQTVVTNESMTKDDRNGLYTYTFDKVDGTLNVIFKDDKDNVLPSADKGLAINAGEIKIYDAGALRDVKDSDLNTYHSNESGAAIVYLKKPADWDNAYIHYWGNEESTWPGVLMNDEGNGLFSFILPEGNESKGFKFNAGLGKEETGDLQSVPSSVRVYDTVTNEWTNMSKIYFDKPSDWEAPYAYAYETKSSKQDGKIEDWPGIAMTHEENGLYSFTISEEYGDAKVIFNSGLEQKFETQTVVLKSGEVKLYSNGTLKTPKASELKEIDKSKLDAALVKADGKKEEDYTAESWNNFKTAINTAKDMPESTQSEINKKVSAINAAINLLEKKVALTTKVYFQNVDNWNEVYVHFWNTTSDTTWPGVKATDEGNGLYSYVLPTIKDGSDSIGVLFNNNNNGIQTKNLSAIEGKTMIYDADSQTLIEYNSGNPEEPTNPEDPEEPGQQETSKTPTVSNTIYMTTTAVKGTAGANADIVLTVDEEVEYTTSAGAQFVTETKIKEKVIGSTKADEEGNWSVQIPAQKRDTVIKVTAKEEDKLEASTTVTVKRKASSNSGSSSSSSSSPVSVSGNTTTVKTTDATTIRNQILTAATPNIKVDLSTQPTVGRAIFEALAGNQNKSLTLVGNNASWIFNGANVLGNNALDLDTTIKSISPNASMINNLTGGKEIVNLSFAHRGALPGRATIQAKVDTKYNDKVMNLYSYNSAYNRLNLLAASVPVTNGAVSFEVTKGSDYILSETAIPGAVKEGWNQNVNSTWIYVKDENNVIGWIKDGANWYLTDNSGVMKTGWAKVNGSWYYLDRSGAMQTGWVNDNGTWYFMSPFGDMLFNTSINGYTLGSNGALVK